MLDRRNRSKSIWFPSSPSPSPSPSPTPRRVDKRMLDEPLTERHWRQPAGRSVSAARDRRHDRQLVGLLDRRIEPVEPTDVLGADEDLDERLERALAIEQPRRDAR